MSFSMGSCLPDPLDIEIDPPAEKIVVSSALIPGQGVLVALTRSFSALNAGLAVDSTLLNSLLIADAEVIIIENSSDTYTLQKAQDGLYFTNEINPVTGNRYRLIATDFQTGLHVEAESVVREQVTFSNVEALLEPSGPDTLIRIDYTFEPLAGEDYYMINVQKFPLNLGQSDLGIDINLIEPNTFTHLIADTDINGPEVSNDFIVLINEDFHAGDTLIASLASIGAIYFDYLEKRNNSLFGSSFVAEPYNAPSNVENGLGFFNLHIPDIRIVIVE